MSGSELRKSLGRLVLLTILLAGIGTDSTRGQVQVTDLESAVRELFGGEVVIGEVPELLASSIPLPEGVEVVAAHVMEDRFTAILSSERDTASLLFESSSVLSRRGWRAASIGGAREGELSFCGPKDELLRVLPRIGAGMVSARVELSSESPECKFVKGLRELRSAGLENPARQLLTEVEPAPGCAAASAGGGSTGRDGCRWTARSECPLGASGLSAHYEKRWRELGWTPRHEDEGPDHRLSTWEVPELEGRRWYAVFLVSSVTGEDASNLMLSLTALPSERAAH